MQAWDRYGYVNNNPLRYTDPTGHCIGVLAPFCGQIILAAIAVAIVSYLIYDSIKANPPDVEAIYDFFFEPNVDPGPVDFIETMCQSCLMPECQTCQMVVQGVKVVGGVGYIVKEEIQDETNEDIGVVKENTPTPSPTPLPTSTPTPTVSPTPWSTPVSPTLTPTPTYQPTPTITTYQPGSISASETVIEPRIYALRVYYYEYDLWQQSYRYQN